MTQESDRALLQEALEATKLASAALSEAIMIAPLDKLPRQAASALQALDHLEHGLLEALSQPAAQPVAAQCRFMVVRKEHPLYEEGKGFGPWQECSLTLVPPTLRAVDAVGYVVEYRHLYEAAQPVAIPAPTVLQALEALDELESSARGDEPFNHAAAPLVRAVLTAAQPVAIPAQMETPPLYPDESREDQLRQATYARGWNACRAAMLNAAPAVTPAADIERDAGGQR